MTLTTSSSPNKLIHIARIYTREGFRYLYLRQTGQQEFTWYEEAEEKTEVVAFNVEEAMRLAARRWKQQSFTPVICGFKYYLPERDEHGINALFHQMSASYQSMNGVYYDEELGNNCFVQNASKEAYDLWQRLKTQNRL